MTDPVAGPTQLLFLPGALGRTDFWHPVADALAHPAARVHVSWPGFDGAPTEPAVLGLEDLAARVVARMEAAGPSALIAQSMGGVVAILAALRRPDLVTHLVLSVTSGGMDMAGLGAEDWRPAVRAQHPALPAWFLDFQRDLSSQLRTLRMPALLLWGDVDPLSPVRAGARLASLLPRAELHVIRGGQHDLGFARAPAITPLIDRHLATP